MYARHYIPHPALHSFVKKMMLYHYQLDATQPKPLNPLLPLPVQVSTFI